MTVTDFVTTLRMSPAAGRARRFIPVACAWITSASLITGTASAEPASGEAEAAPSKTECAESFEQSQRLRNSSRYLEASKEASRCGNASCGAVLSGECTKIYDELQAATPSVVFGAQDEQGKELGGVTVQIDGEPTPVALDGKPVALDPGSHEFTFAADGFEPAHQSAVIRTGERFRAVTGVLSRVKTSDQSEETAGRRVTAREHAGPPLASYVLGGVAIVGFGGFAFFRLSGAHDYDALSKSCKPNCAPDAVDPVRRKYLFSNIALAVGGAATVGALSIYFLSQPSAPKTTALQVLHTGDGIAARVTTSF